jgi:hypothetical protein
MNMSKLSDLLRFYRREREDVVLLSYNNNSNVELIAQN